MNLKHKYSLLDSTDKIVQPISPLLFKGHFRNPDLEGISVPILHLRSFFRWLLDVNVVLYEVPFWKLLEKSKCIYYGLPRGYF